MLAWMNVQRTFILEMDITRSHLTLPSCFFRQITGLQCMFQLYIHWFS